MRTRARVEGVVQGVGFRPFVHRLAGELRLDGFVRNDERGVVLEVEGERAHVGRFLSALRSDPPPMAVVERVLAEDVEPLGTAGFVIVDSEEAGPPAALVSADVATCPDCLVELFDPRDRRYRYPFVNCTNCGPRFTIVRGVPYDRPRTTMAEFAMCDACRAEYEDPGDRRFHAQPIACPVCGPALLGPDALPNAVRALLDGRIVAVKGLGGYHLACRADDEAAVARLRARKHREDKPFALMAPDLVSAHEIVELGAAEEALLTGPERPIVLAPRRADALVAPSVAPRSRELGVMLPYTPLHHLLLADTGLTLVMTSGNVADEPIAFEDADARERLGGIADVFLVHDRPIHTRTDDSVVRGDVFVRRARGYVPASLPLAAPRPLLACGAELKSTFCLAGGERAWVSHHIGDLRNYETLRSFAEGVAHFQRLFGVRPEVVAHDLHPDYLSTRYATERDGVEHVAVQHHHAHLAACLAEHGAAEPAVGAIYDGTGLGPDGTVWGGELLVGSAGEFVRAGHLWPVRLPGGERAIQQPWRMACAWLEEALGEPAPPLAGIDARRWDAVGELARTGVAAPVTTSVGRLFDALAAICGVGLEINYEGQAAVELEAAAEPGDHGRYDLPVSDDLVLDPRPLLRAAWHDAGSGTPPGVIAARFHDSLADATAIACAAAAGSYGLGTVVLSGGVFLNRRLLEATAATLRRTGLRVLVPERLPPGDGGLSYGQAAVAAARDL